MPHRRGGRGDAQIPLRFRRHRRTPQDRARGLHRKGDIRSPQSEGERRIRHRDGHYAQLGDEPPHQDHVQKPGHVPHEDRIRRNQGQARDHHPADVVQVSGGGSCEGAAQGRRDIRRLHREQGHTARGPDRELVRDHRQGLHHGPRPHQGHGRRRYQDHIREQGIPQLLRGPEIRIGQTGHPSRRREARPR